MPAHRLTRRRRFTRLDRTKDRMVFVLDHLEIGALALGPVGGHPDALARNDVAAEIFEKMRELRVAGGGGDGAVKGEILIDSTLAAPYRTVDRRKCDADFAPRRGGRTRRREAGRLDFDANNPNTHLVGLAWMDAGARNFYDTKKPIQSIADLKGLKIRVMGNPMFVEMMTNLGGNGVAMGYDQVLSALQTGVVDGAENNPPSFYFDHHYEVAKYYTLTEHLIVPEILVFSRSSWDKLSTDDQALITKLAREAQLDERQLWKKKEAEAMDKMKAAGIQIITISDKTPFQQAVKPLWDKYGAQYAVLVKQIEAVN